MDDEHQVLAGDRQPEPPAEVHERVETTHLDKIITRVRELHVAGMTADEIKSRLAPTLGDTADTQPTIEKPSVPIPLAPSSPPTEEIAQDQRRRPSPGSEVWQFPATISNFPMKIRCLR